MSETERLFGSNTIVSHQDESDIAKLLQKVGIDPALEGEESLTRLKAEIEHMGPDVLSVSHNTFSLSLPPINISVYQGEENTGILFPPSTGLSFNAKDIYDLFFEELPEAMYGTGPFTPTRGFVQSSTIVTLKTDPDLHRKYLLKHPYHKEKLDELIEDKSHEIISITMRVLTSDTQKVTPFSLTLPNLAHGFNNEVAFSFASGNILARETMGVLLGLHRDGGQLGNNPHNYSLAYASAINVIRTNARVGQLGN